MRFFVPITFCSLLLSSCHVAEESITGVYHPDQDQRTRLVLRNDKTFEFAILNPGTDTLLFPSDKPMNYFTTGSWEYVKNKLVLKTLSTEQHTTSNTSVNDSITRFTTISSFNFWNRYGDPISIRSIVVPPAKPKPHFGNSLYFFSQDFKTTDTLKFYFDGYPPFNFPGSVPSTIGNNMHKITLQEPYRPAAFPELRFEVKKNRLIYNSGKLKLVKKP